MSHEVRKNSYLETLYEKYGEDFFKEEVRSDFLVTTERKELWAVLLDLLDHFLEVCDRHDLHYYLTGGFLIGAVRHAGFIPWDDDLDVLMPREDYDRLPEYKDEFLYPFFLQTPHTDKYYAATFTRLRNSETTMIDPKYLRKNELMNMGVQFDIFPIDKVRGEDALKIRQELQPLTWTCSAYMKRNAVMSTEQDMLQVKQYYDPKTSPADLYEQINSIARRYQNDPEADYIALFVYTDMDYTRYLWPCTCFDHATYMPFEGMSVSVPSGYDKFLRTTYGDYMKFPPVSERGQWHGRCIIRPDTPYLQAIDEYLATLDKTERK